MELEMKYAVPDKETAEKIWENALVTELKDDSTEESLVMKAVYFDTEDLALQKNNITVRVRMEGDHNVATLKWGGSAENGFHERNEVNVPVAEDISFIQPSASMFKDSEDGKFLLNLVQDKPLVNLLETRFLRHQAKLKYKSSVIEMSVDQGSIITDAGEEPILELELELYAGSAEHIKELGSVLAKEYGLIPENRSKFARGLAMLEK